MSENRPLKGLGDVYRPDDEPEPVVTEPPTTSTPPVNQEGREQAPAGAKRSRSKFGGWARLPILLGLVVLINTFDWFLSGWIPFVLAVAIGLAVVAWALRRSTIIKKPPS